MTSPYKKNELNRANAKFSNDSITPDILTEGFDKTNQPTSVMPPMPPPIGADKLSQFVFDNIIEGMAHASAKPIKVDDIKLDEIHSTNNDNFTEENPSLPATPTTMSSVSEQDSDELRQPINTELRNKPLPQQPQVADGFAGLLFDNILAAMKDASVSSQAAQQTDEVQPVAQVAPQTEEVQQQPTSNESATQGLATLMINSIMTGFNPSQVKDVKTKGSIYELFGEPITQETFTYGIGIINTNTAKKFEPELIRHYFLYKQPASGIFNKTEHQPKIFRVDMGQQSFKNINDVFVGKLKTNKLIENYLTQKYVK
jgi:hypothetical protein